MPNKRTLKLRDYGISQKRYKELAGFCEQYPEWQEELKTKIDTLKSKTITDMPSGTKKGNDTEDLAMRREELTSKCKMIEQSAIETDVELYSYIIKSVCYGVPTWHLIDALKMPCSESTFKDKRRYFFNILNKIKK